MQTALECIPCFVRQALDAARICAADAETQERFVRGTLRHLAESDWQRSPPALARDIQRILRAATGLEDPYQRPKARFSALATDVLPGLRVRVAAASDPLAAAAQIAIAGNVIDLGPKTGLTEAEARQELDRALDVPLNGDIESFRRAVQEARHVLYLADNAGEIVLDRVLVERLGHARVTVVVRGAPVINDATLADARAAGLDEIAELISNGSDAPGTILEDCTPVVRRWFDDADLVIAKGQGNYETLCEESRPLFFLLRVKCERVAARLGLPMEAHVLHAQSGSRS